MNAVGGQTTIRKDLPEIMDLAGNRTIAIGIFQRMTQAIVHRGPDEDGYFQRPGLALGSQRLSIVGLADGQQPVANEDWSVSVVFNGSSITLSKVRSWKRAGIVCLHK